MAILTERGALGCRDELIQLAEKTAGPIVKVLLGKAAVPDNVPYTTGGIGLMNERGTRADTPMKPQVAPHALDKLLGDDAIIAADSGTITIWAARYINTRGRMQFAVSGTLASMACAVPYR